MTLSLAGPFESGDGAARYVLGDGDIAFEVVHYRTHGWDAVCASSQAGCGFGCRHCATTYAPVSFQRSLASEEIVESVALVLADRGLPAVRTVDFSGIGDPSRNWEAVAAAGKRLLLAGAASRVTVTTVAPQRWVRARLAGGWLPAKVRISLHGATKKARRAVVTYGDDPAGVVDLWERLAELAPVELNYVMHAGNTAAEDVVDLARLLGGRRFAALRLSPLNDVAGCPLLPCADPERFAGEVRDALPGWVVEQFHPLGAGVEAACGQMRVRALSRPAAARPSARS